MRDMEVQNETVMRIFPRDVTDVGRQGYHRKSKILDGVICVTPFLAIRILDQ